MFISASGAGEVSVYAFFIRLDMNFLQRDGNFPPAVHRLCQSKCALTSTPDDKEAAHILPRCVIAPLRPGLSHLNTERRIRSFPRYFKSLYRIPKQQILMLRSMD
jgi:hypothetical protein